MAPLLEQSCDLHITASPLPTWRAAAPPVGEEEQQGRESSCQRGDGGCWRGGHANGHHVANGQNDRPYNALLASTGTAPRMGPQMRFFAATPSAACVHAHAKTPSFLTCFDSVRLLVPPPLLPRSCPASSAWRCRRLTPSTGSCSTRSWPCTSWEGSAAKKSVPKWLVKHRNLRKLAAQSHAGEPSGKAAKA